jgi:Tol biopolymer transport system component
LAARLSAIWILVLAPLALAAPAYAAFPGANGKIAFAGAAADPSTNCGTYAACRQQIYSVNPDGSGLTQLTNDPFDTADPAWSPDGEKIAFASWRNGSDADIYVMNADGSDQTRLNTNTGDRNDRHPAWSPDGRKIAFSYNLGPSVATINADGTGQATITDGLEPVWSPDGRKILVRLDNNSPDYKTVNPDGSGATPVPHVLGGPAFFATDWAPDSVTLAGTTLSAPASGQEGAAMLTSSGAAFVIDHPPAGGTDASPAWSPDGTKLVFGRTVTSPNGNETFSIDTINADGSGDTPVVTTINKLMESPTWQPIPPKPIVPGYVRPKGATPMLIPLVPAYAQCSSPNSTHGAPLSFGSCTPPQQMSSSLTVGSPDVNGQPAKAVGSIRLRAVSGNPATLQSEADVKVDVNVTDVRCRGATGNCPGPLADYSGALVGTFELMRLTDRLNGISRPDASGAAAPSATVSDMNNPWGNPLRFDVPCAPTIDSTAGSTCSVSTSFAAILPDAAVEGKRQIWELSGVELQDGGEDGNSHTDDNLLFMDQGIFVP